MMRIATPETVWPRHFFNRLNKMQTRASKINEAKNDASKQNAEGANDSDEKNSDNAGGNISSCKSMSSKKLPIILVKENQT